MVITAADLTRERSRTVGGGAARAELSVPLRRTLDWIRGLAALLVCISHVRNLLLQDYHPGLGVAGALFYSVTNLGHPAVMVFFVLSGFFVGGSVLRATERGRFAWGGYLLDRLTRLWTVLLPALLLTWCLDSAGLHLAGGSYYNGTEGNADQVADVAQRLGAATLLCNAAFLQTVACPTYGSNGPLWSLANEFSYYLWFPAVLGMVAAWLPARRARGWGGRLAAVGVGLLALLSALAAPRLSQGFAVWLLGALVGWLASRRSAALASGRRHVWAAAGLFLLLLALARVSVIGDLPLGAGFALLLLALVWREPAEERGLLGGAWDRVLAAGPYLSCFSYSLYLTHFPLVLLVCATVFHRRLALSASAAIAVAAIVALCCLFAAGFYWAFERNTPALRRALSGRYLGAAASADPVARDAAASSEA